MKTLFIVFSLLIIQPALVNAQVFGRRGFEIDTNKIRRDANSVTFWALANYPQGDDLEN